MESPLTISNTTPIINFAEIGRLDLLRDLFGSVVIPPAVQAELQAKAILFPKAAKALQLPWFSIKPPANRLLLNELATRLHSGEAECLALALEQSGSFLLLDDLAAREMAEANGCLFTGSLGCLMEAKQRGLVLALRPLLEDLRLKARFWLSERLLNRVLQEADEA